MILYIHICNYVECVHIYVYICAHASRLCSCIYIDTHVYVCVQKFLKSVSGSKVFLEDFYTRQHSAEISAGEGFVATREELPELHRFRSIHGP